MAKLVEVYRTDKQKLTRRQLPITIDNSLLMIMDLSSSGFLCESPLVSGRELVSFMEMFKSLTPEELHKAFEIDFDDVWSILSQSIPCVGCRRSAEKLFDKLMETGYPALEPLIITQKGKLTIKNEYFGHPQLICTLLHAHSSRLTDLVDNQLRLKKSRRCIMHSLDSSKVRLSCKEVWDIMKTHCREEVLVIEASTLMATLQGYLTKHKFCTECRTKILKAYRLLIEDADPKADKDYVPSLYAGIKRCLQEKHVHLPCNDDYVTSLMARVNPEGGVGDRHAKTIEIAQGEIVTCLGLCLYEKLHQVKLRLKDEETTCQVLATIAVEALSRKFETYVETKRGISKMELLCREFSEEDNVKEKKKEQKKLKKKKRKARKAGIGSKQDEIVSCELNKSLSSSETSLPGLEVIDTPLTKDKVEQHSTTCCEFSQDCGYSSGNNNASSPPSTPDGSEIAIEDFCNDEGVYNRVNNNPEKQEAGQERLKLSLEQMLEDVDCTEEDVIPIEDVTQYQKHICDITKKRKELRQTLRKNFDLLCITHNQT